MHARGPSGGTPRRFTAQQIRPAERIGIAEHDRLRPNRLYRSPAIATMGTNASDHGHCHAALFASRPGQTFILAPSGHAWLRRRPPVPDEGALAFPPYHPPSRAASDRASRGNNDLRNGTARRVPAPLPSHRPLRRLGPGGSRSLDRRPQASLSISEGQLIRRTGREAAPAPPCSRMTSPSNGCSGYAASTRTSTAPGSACAICTVASLTAASRSLASLLKARPT